MRLRWDRLAVLAGIVVLGVLVTVSALTGGRPGAAHAAVATPRPAPTPAATPVACPTPPAGTVLHSAPLPGGRPATRPRPTASATTARDAVGTVGSPGPGAVPAADEVRTVALTFDDGPSRWTPQVLDVLRRNHVPATFFVIGGNAATHPDLVRREVTEGHLVGNHTWTHTPPPSGRTWPATKLAAELDRTDTLLEHLTGRRTCWFRPPAGVLAGTATPASHRGLSVVLWSVDSLDWLVQDRAGADPGGVLARRIVARATADGDQAHPIVLMHDGGGYRQATIDALPTVIAFYRAHGYTFVRLDGQ